jgi:hypothetical protein
MPHSGPEEFPSTLDRWPNIPWRCEAWGEMEVSYSQPKAVDCSEALKKNRAHRDLQNYPAGAEFQPGATPSVV